MKIIRHITAIILFSLLVSLSSGCSNSSQSSEIPTAPSYSESNLSGEESRMFDMLVKLSANHSVPARLKLSEWVKGTLKDSAAAKPLNREAGYEVECISFTIGDSNELYFASVTIDELLVFSRSEIGAIISYPEKYLDSPEIHSQDSVKRINTALEEYYK